jgi:sugar phosphate isomerase/epimerase
MKRRTFIQSSAMTLAGVYLASCAKSGSADAFSADSPVGFQIYTLRDTVTKDPKGVMAKVAQFGYKELESYSYADGNIFGMPFKEFADYVKGLGMQITSGHYPYELATSDKWEPALADAKTIGQKYVVVPWLKEPERASIDSYKRVCENLNKAGEMANKYGLRFGYHNHWFEFDTVDGQLPYDVMLKQLDPKLVSMELDIYWVYKAGQDPFKLFESNPGRFEQWHVKDMDKVDKARNADIGTGTIDWKSIFAKAKQSGMTHFYIEQETYPVEPIKSAEADIKNLKEIIAKV